MFLSSFFMPLSEGKDLLKIRISTKVDVALHIRIKYLLNCELANDITDVEMG